MFRYFLPLLLFFPFFVKAIDIPELNSPIIDQVGLLSNEEKISLSENIRKLWMSGGPQLAIWILPSLAGESLEDLSIRTAEKWKLGNKEKDNGLLFIMAVNDKKMRLEVGNGIEREVTDLESHQLIQKILAPTFRKNQYASGLLLLIKFLEEKFISKESGEITANLHASTNKPRNPIFMALTIGCLIFFFACYPWFQKKTNCHPLARGSYTMLATIVTGLFLSQFQLPLSLLATMALMGLVVGIMGPLNVLLFILASSMNNRRGGGFGGGDGGGFSGGGGGFSGGGSSGGW